MSRDSFNQIRLLNLTLNVSRHEESTLSLDNLCQCFTTLIVNDFFLMFNLKLSSFSLKSLKLVQLCFYVSYYVFIFQAWKKK